MHDNVETHVHEIINKGATRIKVIMASNAWGTDFGAMACMLVRISELSHLHKIMQLDKSKNHVHLSMLNCSYSYIATPKTLFCSQINGPAKTGPVPTCLLTHFN